MHRFGNRFRADGALMPTRASQGQPRPKFRATKHDKQRATTATTTTTTVTTTVIAPTRTQTT